MKKAAAYIVIAISLVVIVATVFVYIGPRFGYSFDSISSGSMEPHVPVGSMTVTIPAAMEDIEEGDIIVFYPLYTTENLLMHRVTEVVKGPPISFVTQGDANLMPDSQKVYSENFFGRVALHVNGMGNFIDFVKDTKGFILLVVVPSVIVLLAYLYSVWHILNENKKKTETD